MADDAAAVEPVDAGKARSASLTAKGVNFIPSGVGEHGVFDRLEDKLAELYNSQVQGDRAYMRTHSSHG